MSAMVASGHVASNTAGLLAYLSEESTAIKLLTLQKLYEVVDVFWAEICAYLPLIEEISEDLSFPGHELAAAIASKCFYHLGELDEALKIALNSGKYLGKY
jgi:26S proteasome regulatory subunit N2